MDALIFSVSVVVVGIVIFIVVAINGRANVLEKRRIIAKSGEELRSKLSLDEIYISEKNMSLIGINWRDRLFYVGSVPNNVLRRSFDQLRSVDLLLDKVTVTQSKSVTRSRGLGSAALGGVMFGAAGAVVGGLAGGSESETEAQTSDNLCNIDIVIRTDDKIIPLYEVNFWDFPPPGISRHEPDIKELLDTAKRFHALLKKIVEDTQSSKSIGQAAEDVPSKLERLWKLHQEGVLTQPEFEAQKRGLLGPSE